MKNSNKARRGAALCLILLLLSACGKGGEDATTPSYPDAHTSSTDSTAITTQATTTTEATTAPPTTEAPTPPGPVSKIDTSFLQKNNLSVQRILVCDDDTVLFFVSPINGDGTISENTMVYSYSFALKGFRAAGYMLGTVNLFPEYTLDDGTVALVTLDSESYDFDSLLFLDPVTLNVQTHPLPAEDFYDLHVSPNKKYVAITTYDYLLVTDIDYATTLAKIERQPVPISDIIYESQPVTDGQPPAETTVGDDESEEPATEVQQNSTPDEATDSTHDGDSHVYIGDEAIPSATGWSADSSMLFYKSLGWEDIYSPGVIYPSSGDVLALEELSGCALLPVDADNIFYNDFYEGLPAGIYNIPSELISGIDYAFPGGYITGMVASPDGKYLCILSMVSEPEAGQMQSCCATVLNLFSGQYVNSFSIDRPNDVVSFEQAFFTPSCQRLLLVASGGISTPRAVYSFDFLME